jgi:hypothetical protein
MSIVMQLCDTQTDQQVELSLAGSSVDLFEKAGRTLCWGCLNISVGGMVGSTPSFNWHMLRISA